MESSSNPSEHTIYFYQQEKYGPVADICFACSDLASGVLVPVSFCPEAQEDSNRLYDALNKEYLEVLFERGKKNDAERDSNPA